MSPLTPDQQRLVVEHIPYADQQVKTYTRQFCQWGSTPVTRADLRQEAYLGLVEAARRYDPRVGVTFRTFAYYEIRGRIFKERQSSTNPVTAPSQKRDESGTRHAVYVFRGEMPDANELAVEEPEPQTPIPDAVLESEEAFVGAVSSSTLTKAESRYLRIFYRRARGEQVKTIASDVGLSRSQAHYALKKARGMVDSYAASIRSEQA